MRMKNMKYEEPIMEIILLEYGDVITWSTQTGAIGDSETVYDSDDFSNMFQ